MPTKDKITQSLLRAFHVNLTSEKARFQRFEFLQRVRYGGYSVVYPHNIDQVGVNVKKYKIPPERKNENCFVPFKL